MKKFCLFTAIILASLSLFADQAAWITKEQAEKGAELIKKSGEIRRFCAPCGDNFYRVEKVSSSVASKADAKDAGNTFYEVKVNDAAVDLAYVYLLSGGKWKNAATLFGIKVQGVPEILPEDVPDDEVDPADMPSEHDTDDYYEAEDMPLEGAD